MNDFEAQKFKDHYQEKITKLKNPNHIVSETRIMLKNLPKKGYDDDDIKEMIEKFKKESIKQPNKKVVRQIKFLMDKDKFDKETGLAKNKGICFIDFYEHEHGRQFIQYII